MNPEKEIRLQMSFKNNVLLQAIKGDWGSIAHFCRVKNLSYGSVRNLINLEATPINEVGEYSEICLKLSIALGIDVETLFPARLYRLKSRTTIEVSLKGLAVFEDQRRVPSSTPRTPEQELEMRDLAILVRELIQTLYPREAKVVEWWFGIDRESKSLEGIASELEVPATRVKTILSKAIERLRHPSRANRLAAYC